jgi:proteic killer suppression protein
MQAKFLIFLDCDFRPIEWYTISPGATESRLFRKLQMIDDATTDQDLRVPPSNHFEKLRGDLGGLHSIRVNKQWRLIFRWDSSQGEASGIYLDDHSYQ